MLNLKNKFDDDTLLAVLNMAETTQIAGLDPLSIPEHALLYIQLLQWMNNTICYE